MKQLSWAVLLFVSHGLMAAEVYRSVDSNGVVSYSDRPSGAAEEVRLDIKTVTPVLSPPQQSPSAGPAAAQTAAQTAAASAPAADVPRPPTRQEIAADRARNCQIARDKDEAYNNSHRLYRNLPDGEREYLTSAEIDEARTAAAADVAAWCD